MPSKPPMTDAEAEMLGWRCDQAAQACLELLARHGITPEKEPEMFQAVLEMLFGGAKRIADPPRKIHQLIKDLQDAGFMLVSQRGSHRKFRHAKKPDSVILSGASDEDAKLYQEKQVGNALASL